MALGAFILAVYWPMVQLLDLSRADLQSEGVWVGGNARQVTAVTPGGVADRAGLRAGDVLEFDPGKDEDWVLASYRNMPAGFSATLPVRHADGSKTLASLAPERVSYLPTLNDRLALLARLSALTIAILLGVFVVWARPSLMAWCLLLAMIATAPVGPWKIHYFAFEVGHGFNLYPVLALFAGLVIAAVPFALCFPRNALAAWSWWKRALGLAVVLVWLSWLSFFVRSHNFVAFEHDAIPSSAFGSWAAIAVLSALAALAVFWQTYRKADGSDRARLKWAMLGMSAVLVASILVVPFFVLPFFLSNPASGSGLTPVHWTFALCYGFFWPLALGYAILRQRVVDVQFAVSRTLVYGAVSTVALVVVAAVHWLFGRLIEHSGLTLGLEGAAAIGVGLVLHRATHGINLLVDRVLFSKHHQAEQRLRQVTAALPFAADERSIAEALVVESVRHLDLASAALFYRDSAVGPLRRVLAHGWSDDHATTLDADAMLVRYLQAEHGPLKLDDAHWLPAGVPDGAALPVLAVPIVNQHALAALMLYGGHTNSTLLDPDEVKLLEALAKAAATAHQQVRIAMLTRENEAKERQIEQITALAAELRALVHGSAGAMPIIPANLAPAQARPE
jgi:hypothetical protein